jgi:hypothetical protein
MRTSLPIINVAADVRRLTYLLVGRAYRRAARVFFPERACVRRTSRSNVR